MLRDILKYTAGGLFIYFVIAKLAGEIDWSWWLVCSPLIILGCIFILISVVMTVLAYIVGGID